MVFGRKKINEERLKGWVDKELEKGLDMDKIKDALNRKYNKKDVDKFLENNYMAPEDVPGGEEEADELPTGDEPEDDLPEIGEEASKKTIKKPKNNFSLDENEMALVAQLAASSEEYKVYQQYLVGQKLDEIVTTYNKSITNRNKLPNRNEV